MDTFDYIIIGAGFYGLQAARYLGNKGYNVCVLEKEPDAFTKASFINQARVHNGYHYPRSFSTALKSKEYFNRFVNDFGFAINKTFEKIYAISDIGSKITSMDFEIFCQKLGVPCEEIDKKQFFKKNIDKAYKTLEYAFDAIKIRDFMKEEISRRSNIKCYYYYNVNKIQKGKDGVIISSSHNDLTFRAKNVINATYAGINEINLLFGVDKINIKYELTEMILCDVSPNIRNYGLTVMDGDFFSIMPFGIGGKFSLSSVKYTPHEECHDNVAKFKTNKNLFGIPETNFSKMIEQVKDYFNDDIEIRYDKSLFTTKVVLANAEGDDARPTFIKKYDLGDENNLITIFSGKINTIYEIEDFFINNNI